MKPAPTEEKLVEEEHPHVNPLPGRERGKKGDGFLPARGEEWGGDIIGVYSALGVGDAGRERSINVAGQLRGLSFQVQS